VHPCKHANVMKKVIERMNNSVVAQQLQQQAASNGKGAAAAGAGAGQKKGKWLFRRASGKEVPQAAAAEGDDDADGMRVDFYLVVFLKFIASIVPTIEVDSTTSM
jgi:ubiquitin-like-conjugating enzyme ATG3